MEEQRKPLVFIVEDDEMYSMVLDYKLSNDSIFRFVCFTNGEECVKNLHMRPMMVILDYDLPGMNGIQTTAEIQRFDPHLPVIVITAKPNKETAMRFIKMGVLDYLNKEKDTSGKIMSLLNSFLVKKTRVLRETANTLNKQILDGLM